jgi:hypothetical protein
MKKFIVLAIAALIVCVSVGCAKKMSIEEGKAKIAELIAKGVPEREMTTLRMYLFQMETAQKIGNSSQFKIYQDSLTTALTAFEEEMNALLERAGPFMDSLRRACDDKIAQLKGMHLEEAEKGKGSIDSIMQIESKKLDARFQLESYSFQLDTLIMMQNAADSLRDQFAGTWGTEQEHKGDGNDVFEWTYITMNPNGTFLIEDGKKSRLNDGTRENWAFNKSGTWDLKGDVVYHFVTREKCLYNEYTGFDPQLGKQRTVKHPTYDSTFAKGKKFEYISWDALNKEYTRAPKRTKRR